MKIKLVICNHANKECEKIKCDHKKAHILNGKYKCTYTEYCSFKNHNNCICIPLPLDYYMKKIIEREKRNEKN